jgi:competence protein ComGC
MIHGIILVVLTILTILTILVIPTIAVIPISWSVDPSGKNGFSKSTIETNDFSLKGFFDVKAQI